MISEYLYQKASANKVPLNGTFELSPVCNLACKMCYVRRTPKQLQQQGKQLIHWEKWLDLARQCREAGTLYLLLTGGEPFLYPGFRELYTRLHQMGFLIAINTNATLIDRETVDWLKQAAPYRLNVTLYGASPETYRRICGQADGFERTIAALRMMKEAGLRVIINASMIPENQEDLEAIFAIGKELGLYVRMSTYMFPPMRREKESGDSRFAPEESAQMYLRRLRCQNTREECEQMMRIQIQRTAQLSGAEDDWGSDVEYMRCRAGRSTFWVNWEGYMTACGMLDFPRREQPFLDSFSDCWSRLTDAVRTTPVLQGCAGCRKREVCRPCVAMIYGETGRVDEKAPYLCRLADEVLRRMEEELEELDHEQRQ